MVFAALRALRSSFSVLRSRLFSASSLVKVAAVLAIVVGGAQSARADSCSAVFTYSVAPGQYANLNVAVTLTAGETITWYTAAGGTSTPTFALQQETPFGYPYNPTGTPGSSLTGAYTIQTTGSYKIQANTTNGVALGCVQTGFTVTNALDTTSGVAANCQVSTLSPGSCSLRDALAAATAAGYTGIVVSFDPTVFTAATTITEAHGTLNVPTNTTIQGPTTGSAATLTNLITVSGGGSATLGTNGVFTVASGVTATIANLTISNGSLPTGQGGGVYNSGTLTLNQCTVSNNYAAGAAGLFNLGTLNVNQSTISGNVTTNSAGGIGNSTGSLTVTYSTVSGNSAASNVGGIYVAAGTATISHSTISANTAAGFGGGVYATNATNITNSIVSGNSASGGFADIDGTPASTSGSIVGTSTGTTSNGTAVLAPLGFYGGPTQTMPNLPTSAAFCTSSTGSGTDQRGVTIPTGYPTGVSGTYNCADTGATNSNYSMVWSTPNATYPIGVNFTTSPTLSFEDDGVVLPFTTASNTVYLSDTAGSFTGGNLGNFTNGVLVPTAINIPVAETADALKSGFGFGPGMGLLHLSPTSGTFNVANAAPAGFTISTLTSPTTAGTTQGFTVTALSALPSTVYTGYTGTVAFTSTDSAATLPGNYTFTGTDAGVHTFNSGLTLKTSGSQTVTVTDTATSTATKTSNAVTVTAAAVSKLLASTGTPQSSFVGGAFLNPLVAEAVDAYSNPVSGVSVTFTAPGTGQSATITGSPATTASSTGLASVTAIANGTAGSYNVTASATGATSATFALTNTSVTFVVDSTSDTAATGSVINCLAGHAAGTCTLRSAIATVNAFVNSTATISFDPTVFATAQTITLGTGGTLQLTGSGDTVNIVGPGQTLLTVSGADTYQILSQANGATALAISNISLVHGKTSGSGGAVNSAYTALTLTNVTMSNNAASSEGAFNSASAVVTGSTFTNNSTTGSDGVFYANSLTLSNSTFTGNTSGGQAGVGYARDNYNVTNCVFTNNKALNGVGGTLITNTGGFTITGSSFVGNSASSAGGAINMNASGSLTIQNSTFYGNSAPQGGAINANNVTMINDTVTGNTTTAGAAVYLAGGNALFNNTIYGNTGGGLQTTSAPGGTDNIVAANTGLNCLGSGCPTDPSNILTGSGFLLPLGTYGATTLQTMPAIVGGAAYRVESSSYYATDEIGGTRPTSGANSSDAGAVQSAVTASWTTQPPASTVVNTNFTAAVTLKEFGNAISLSGPATVSIPVTLTGNGTLTGSPMTTMSAAGVVTGTFSVSAAGTGDTLTVNGVASNSFNITAPPQIAPSVATVSASGSATYGSTTGITVTATESGTNGAATGDVVTFGVAGGVGGTFSPTTCSISSAGTCTTTYTPSGTLAVGTYTSDITASFAAGTNYLLATASGTLTVTAATPTVGTVTLSPASTEPFGTSQIITMSAPLTYAGALPTGAVTFSLNSVNYTATCTGASPATCSATVPAATIAALPVSSTGYTVGVSIAAAGNYTTATGTSSKLFITGIAPTVATVSAITAPYGSKTGVTVTATESGTGGAVTGGVVTFGVTAPATGSFSPTTCTLTSAGTCTTTFTPTGSLGVGTYSTISASFGAVGNYSVATGTTTETIAATAPTVATVSAVSTTYGSTTAVTVTATESGTAGVVTGGVVTFGLAGGVSGSFSAATCTLTAAGTCTTTYIPTGTQTAGTYAADITAGFAQVGSYLAATGTSTLTVNQATQAVTFSATPASPQTYSATPVVVTLNTLTSGASGSPVVYSLTAGSQYATLSGNTLTLTGAGSITIAANQAGTTNYSAAPQVTQTFVVNLAAQAITFVQGSVTMGQPVTLTATGGASGNPVTFAITGGTVFATLSGNVLTPVAPGVVTVTASQAASANYNAATNVTQSFAVVQAGTAVTLTSSGTPVLLGSQVTLTATVSASNVTPAAGDTVIFYDGPTVLATVTLVNGKAVLATTSLAVGTHAITAFFGGDVNLIPQTSASVSEVVEDFTLNLSATGGGSQSVAPGQSTNFNFVLGMTNGANFPAAVILTAAGGAEGSGYHVEPADVSGWIGTQPVTLTVQVPAQTASAHDLPYGKGIALATLLLLPFLRRKSRVTRLLSVALLLLVSAGAMTGCGAGVGFFSSTPTTSVITVTATSGTLSRTASVTLTIQ